MSDLSWLIFVAIYLFTDSLRIFIDNYTSDVYFKGKGAASQKIFHGACQVAIALIALPLASIDPSSVGWPIILTFVAAGFLSSFAGIPFYKALELDDSTNLGIFMQLSPVLYLILGWLFLGQTISPLQLIAFVIILSAPALILKTASKRSKKLKARALFYAFLYVFIIVVSNLIFVKESDAGLSLIGQFALFFLGKGIFSIGFIPLRKKWRTRFGYVMHRHPRKLPRLLLTNTIIGVIADITFRIALILAPSVALASAASDSVEPIVIFFMGIILTLINKKFGREKLTKKSILVHSAATVLVVAGIVLIQF